MQKKTIKQFKSYFWIIFVAFKNYLNESFKTTLNLVSGILIIWIGASLILNLPIWVPLDIGQNSSEKVLAVIKRQIDSDEQILKTYRKKTEFFDRIILFTEPKRTVDKNSDAYFKQKYRIYIFQNEERNSLQDFFKLDNWKKMSNFEFPLNSKNEWFTQDESKPKEDLNFRSIKQCSDLKPLNSSMKIGLNVINNIFCEIKNSSTSSYFLICTHPYGQVAGANRIMDYGIFGCSVLQLFFQENFLVKPNFYVGGGFGKFLADESDAEIYCGSIYDGCNNSQNFLKNTSEFIAANKLFIRMINDYSNSVSFLNRPTLYINNNSEMLILFEDPANKPNFNTSTYESYFTWLNFSTDNFGGDRYQNFISSCINYDYYLMENFKDRGKIIQQNVNSCNNLIKVFYENGADGIVDFNYQAHSS